MAIWVTEEQLNHRSGSVKSAVKQAISSGKWRMGIHYIKDKGALMINADELHKVESALRQKGLPL